MASHERLISIIRASVIDRRATNVRYRQTQLRKLHSSLCERSNDICKAIQDDLNVTQTEASAEFTQTLQSIRNAYKTLDNDTAHKEEYSIVRGESSLNRKIPRGLVVIRPSTFTRLYSVLQPLSAAISTGNCVLIELQEAGLSLDLILRGIIATLDHAAYVVVDTTLSPAELPEDSFVIDQSHEPVSTHIGLPSSYNLAIAVVDRTANLADAAHHITNSRLLFQGRSPYAPDLVLVNEFVISPFADEIVKCIYASLVRRADQRVGADSTATSQRLTKATKSGECSVLHSSIATVVEIKDRSSMLLGTKLSGSNIVLLSTRSLTDVSNIVAQFPNLLAGYYFGQLAAGKFLSQALDAHASFVNYIPWALLLGPPAPAGYPLSLTERYTADMLTAPRPEYVASKLELSSDITKALKQNDPNLPLKQSPPLKPIGQGSGTSIGFFEQGILTGLIIIVFPILAGASYLTYTSGKVFIGYLRK